ncbi:hypothetical protein GRI97_13245 [Altererythrobacter xixiisoli]|uniref:Lipoprotein n=1 Tax=Croceibacterium xixiisoli TaxID=1476466 RepID=A0A6I4U011_9SPHN|nr:hypothetical protein [Croceibacterium xixiisoli]MXO99953.1 hypothetical protein [Croceibacterium xixiisoli]
MNAPRATYLLAGAAALLAATAPATAQVNGEVVLNIMRECAKIDDPSARLACYDNNIRAAGANPRTVPGNAPAPRGGGAPVAATGNTAGFGGDSIRTAERFQTPAGEASEITARIASIQPREPGVYLVELEDGAQWLFSESVPNNFGVPRRGDTVRIARAAMGSFLMRIDKQAPVRVRRVR